MHSALTFPSRYQAVCEILGSDPLTRLRSEAEDYLNQNAVSSILTVLVSSLLLDHYREKEGDADYYLGVFLVGAYQEILGDMHNLLGDTNAVHVSLSPDGQVRIEEVIEGDTVREVLAYVQYSADELKRTMRKRVEQAFHDQKISLDESRLFLKFYESGLEGYTYLE